MPLIVFDVRGDFGLPTSIYAFHSPAPYPSSGCRLPWRGEGLLTGRVGDGGMEAAEVDEGVGAQEEVGDDGGNGIELSFRDPARKRTVC